MRRCELSYYCEFMKEYSLKQPIFAVPAACPCNKYIPAIFNPDWIEFALELNRRLNAQ